MTRKVTWVILSVFLVTSLLIGSFACAKPAPSPTPSPAPAPATTAAPAPKPTTTAPTTAPAPKPTTTAPTAAPVAIKTLKVSIMSGKGGGAAPASDAIMAEIEKRSNGRIKFEPYYNQTLLTLRATHQGLKTGVADMAYHWHAAEPAKLPLSQFSLYLGTMMNTWAGVKAWEEFVELPAIKAEWEKEGMKPLWGFGAPIYAWLGNKPVEKWEDLKGQRVYGGAPIPEIMAKVGITAVDLPAAELYEALLRGTLDSIFYPMASVPLWKFQEVAKYYNLDFPGVGGKMYGYVITLDVWNKLPPDLQQIMLLKDFDVAGTVYKLYDLAESKRGVDAVKAKGVKELHSTPETIKQLDELAVKPIRDAYAAELDKKGLPGTAMLKAWLDLNKKYEALFPAEAKKQGWQ